MVEVIKREKAHFRIEIRDLTNGKTKSFSLANHINTNVNDIAQDLINYLDHKKIKAQNI